MFEHCVCWHIYSKVTSSNGSGVKMVLSHKAVLRTEEIHLGQMFLTVSFIMFVVSQLPRFSLAQFSSSEPLSSLNVL